MLRGGSWNNNNPRNLLSSYRNNDNPGNRNNNIGFRVVLSGGGSGSKVLYGRRDVAREISSSATGAKKPPNRCHQAPVGPGKRRGGRRGR